MKYYTLPVNFIFDGTITVEAPSRAAAVASVEQNVGLVLGSGIHTTDPGVTWQFDPHAYKEVFVQCPYCPGRVEVGDVMVCPHCGNLFSLDEEPDGD